MIPLSVCLYNFSSTKNLIIYIQDLVSDNAQGFIYNIKQSNFSHSIIHSLPLTYTYITSISVSHTHFLFIHLHKHSLSLSLSLSSSIYLSICVNVCVSTKPIITDRTQGHFFPFPMDDNSCLSHICMCVCVSMSVCMCVCLCVYVHLCVYVCVIYTHKTKNAHTKK